MLAINFYYQFYDSLILSITISMWNCESFQFKFFTELNLFAWAGFVWIRNRLSDFSNQVVIHYSTLPPGAKYKRKNGFQSISENHFIADSLKVSETVRLHNQAMVVCVARTTSLRSSVQTHCLFVWDWFDLMIHFYGLATLCWLSKAIKYFFR